MLLYICCHLKDTRTDTLLRAREYAVSYSVGARDRAIVAFNVTNCELYSPMNSGHSLNFLAQPETNLDSHHEYRRPERDGFRITFKIASDAGFDDSE